MHVVLDQSLDEALDVRGTQSVFPKRLSKPWPNDLQDIWIYATIHDVRTGHAIFYREDLTLPFTDVVIVSAQITRIADGIEQ
jgi:hypothetical protein